MIPSGHMNAAGKTAAFLYHEFLVEREFLAALRKLPSLRVVAINAATYSTPEQARLICRLLTQRGCSIVFTVNDWGMDFEGETSGFLQRNNIVHVNWCTDDPFFLKAVRGVCIPPASNRVDFVTDRAAVGPMNGCGYAAHFLPLAVDPSLFYPDSSRPDYMRDVCFVGNSYFEDVFVKYMHGHEAFIEKQTPFIAQQAKAYLTTPRYDIEQAVSAHVGRLAPGNELSKEMAGFLLKHTIGYFYRKDIVADLAARYPGFMVFGDAGWDKCLPAGRVSGTVHYYGNLCETYRRTRVNIDINRVVIREGFTQRVFDCLACGSFVITSAKAIVNEFFETSGEKCELCMFETRDDLCRRIDYYLAREKERNAIAARGRRKILAEHTYEKRVAQMMNIVKKHM